MPVVYLRKRQHKKALRDNSITENFFNQGEPSTPSSSAEQSHSHATNLPASATVDATVENLRTKMPPWWNKKYNDLTSEVREKVQGAIEILSLMSDPHKVLKTLDLTKDQIDIVLATGGDRLLVKETFDLADLDEVAKGYDKHCQQYKLKGENQMATLAINISSFASIASDTTRSTETRLAAKLDVLNLNIDSKITVPLISCLRQVQLFNMEKRFGFVEESYQALRIEDERKLGEDVPTEMPLSCRQMLNDLFKPTEPAPGPGQKKEEKKLSGLEALAQLQDNLKLASEEIQDLKATNDTQDFEEVPCKMTYVGVPIPQPIPDHVHRRFLDADFGLEQMGVIMREAYKQLNKVRGALRAWSRSHQTWEAGKKLVHELPLFREYEYNRTALNAMLLIVARQEVKIMEFFSGKREPEFPLAMKKAFRLESMSLDDFEQNWEKRCLQMHDRFRSVDMMIAQPELITEENLSNSGWREWLTEDLP